MMALAQARTEAALRRIWVGGAFPYGARRAIRYGDGWMPQACARPHIRQRARTSSTEFHNARSQKPGRSVPVTIWGAKEDEDMLKADRDAGVVRVIVSLESAESDVILPQLDRWAKLLQKVS